MPTVSILIVNYNGGELLLETLRSLERQTRPPDEVIVVDNASTDGSADALPPGVTLIRSAANLGFTGGNNLALQHAKGEYIGLLNSDAVATERWIEELAQTLDREPRAAVAEGKILFPADPPRIDQAGALFNDLGNYWGRGYNEIDDGQYDTPAEVAGVTGCAMMLRRSSLDGEPLFDDSLFMYGEELDLTIRLRERGRIILYNPNAVVWHRGMHSLQRAQENPRLFQQLHANRNRLKLIAKYYPARILIGRLPLLVLGMLYWNVFFLRHGGVRYFIRAIGEQVRYLRAGLRERRELDASKWLAWMTRQRLADILALKRKVHVGVRRPT